MMKIEMMKSHVKNSSLEIQSIVLKILNKKIAYNFWSIFDKIS